MPERPRTAAEFEAVLRRYEVRRLWEAQEAPQLTAELSDLSRALMEHFLRCRDPRFLNLALKLNDRLGECADADRLTPLQALEAECLRIVCRQVGLTP